MGVDEYVSECESECNFSSILFVSSSCFTFYLFCKCLLSRYNVLFILIFVYMLYIVQWFCIV